MEYKIYKEDDFRVSNWMGGKTTQLAIFPETAKYLERNFIWRLSSATCEKEESDFSKLAEFDRVLMVLQGDVVLAHQDVRVARLGELEQDSFDGGYSTKSFGKITDYNLILAKGNKGFLDVITPGPNSQTPELESYPEYEQFTQGYYCRDGFATITIDGETMMLTPGQQLVINCENGKAPALSVMGEGHLVRAQIFYNYHQEEMGPTIIPKEKACFDDYKACIFLANTQFRGASFIFKKLKSQWYDEELTASINKIEKLYLTFFIGTFGFAALAVYGLERFTGIEWVLSIVGWFLIDIFLISPSLYLAVVPKPVRKHIKDINNLTPYEQRVLEKQLATNERLEKLLKKYKNSGRYQYDEDGNSVEYPYKKE
ncbi:MAG: HutD family protein [Emergencia timonensis]|uniref:HutD/Ves family protein n=1 Tax=Emergencia timonensis TaxID=1776384 RepID=UPI000829C0DC|nr:HutD family protein [Emergencia timonensis]WNX88312.1 HutD family protein [Emergencia timonensis]